jgi:hypothetical protein
MIFKGLKNAVSDFLHRVHRRGLASSQREDVVPPTRELGEQRAALLRTRLTRPQK